ncbi:MAG: glycosyltransferase family 10 [Candidatus Daviesbacteria bacterium]|nr:glycosyltransferase family 10 [Candidatus Daviesbacteria bacterium]
MKKIYIALKPFNNKVFYRNDIFNEKSPYGSSYLIAARKLLVKKNIIMNTIDIASDPPTQKDIYMDVPYPWDLMLWIRLIKYSKKSILFIIEPPLVNPFNFMKIFHIFFSRVYTQKDDLIDNAKYFKFFLPKTKAGIETKLIPFKNKKLLILMNGNLSPFLPFRLLSFSTKELYSERIKAINFFEENYPSEFSLYGRGWNKPQRFSIMQRLFGFRRYKTYRGEFLSKDKYKLLSKFKFSLCFENCKTTGYISEKIIDCFKAKCVPVYRGAPNIDKFIPTNCYIDANAFKDYQEIYTYLINMGEEEYNTYIQNIEELLQDRKFQSRWFPEGFAKFFLRVIAS